MGRKFFYILTVLLFSLSISSFGYGIKKPFLFNGGTTSDGIVISTPEIDGFQMTDKGGLTIVEQTKKATMIFSVIVPNGKMATLEYNVFIKLMVEEGKTAGRSRIIKFTAKKDKIAKTSQDRNLLDINSDIITLEAGKHYITLEASYSALNCIMAGGINAMYIHVHDFSETRLLREPICGQRGEKEAKCAVCGIDSTIYLPPKYKEHSLKESSTTNTSCLSNMGKLRICEHCPYSEIERKDSIKSHVFGADDKCTVCGLHKPKSNADHSVYEVYDASEMRILAEMVQLGQIPGNIGIDIKADLKFSNEVTMLPLGSFEHPFQGVINGNGHRIRGIVNCFQGIDCLGLVGVAKGTLKSHAVIANLIFDAENTMKGTACVGGIVGYAAYCDIINCASFGVLEGQNYVGSLVGYADQHVTFQNCASVSPIRTAGHWNPMACGLPYGHILNSYGAATNSMDGEPDELTTTTFRHCFTTHGEADGLKLVSRDMMSTYNMLELLNEESDSTTFMMSQNDSYPIPVVNTDIKAMPNPDIPTVWNAIPRRVQLSELSEDGGIELSEKEREIEIIGGYSDDDAIAASGTSFEEVIKKDSVDYADFDRTYIVTRIVSDEEFDEGFELFKPMDGGELLSFESYMLSPDSTFLRKSEYLLVSPEKVKPVVETIDDWSGMNEQIDEYALSLWDNSRELVSRTIIEDENNITYQENIDGTLKTKWNISTTYDEEQDATIVEVYSHDYVTGEIRLEYSTTYKHDDSDEGKEDETIVEYVDEASNTILVISNDLDPNTGAVTSTDYIILNATNESVLQYYTEKKIDGQPYLTDGMYFIYDNEGALVQAVAYGPEDEKKPGENLRPYLYYEYLGAGEPNPYPTAIKVPTAEKPSLQKHTDYNVYDMHGRVVRKVTDMRDPFSGLPKGLYIYQGKKYLKRN